MCMFEGRTPERKSEERAPETRAEIIVGFQRAWTMAILRWDPGVFFFFWCLDERAGDDLGFIGVCMCVKVGGGWGCFKCSGGGLDLKEVELTNHRSV